MKVLKYSLFFTTVASTSKLHEPLITSGCGIGAKARSGFPDAKTVEVDSKTSTTGSNRSSFFIGSPLPGRSPPALITLTAASRMFRAGGDRPGRGDPMKKLLLLL